MRARACRRACRTAARRRDRAAEIGRDAVRRAADRRQAARRPPAARSSCAADRYRSISDCDRLQHARDVVEAVAGIVGRQESATSMSSASRSRIALLVLGAIQPVKVSVRPGFGCASNAADRARTEPGDERVLRRLVGTRPCRPAASGRRRPCGPPSPRPAAARRRDRRWRRAQVAGLQSRSLWQPTQ